MRDLYQSVTDKIIEQLEAGAVPWLKPWNSNVGHQADTQMPRNAVTGRPYSGVNVLTLWAQSACSGYDSGRWLTFNQAKASGGSVMRGMKGTEVIFVKKLTKEQFKPDGSKETVSIPLLRAYTVFNVAQCERLPAKLTEGKPLPPAPELDATFKRFSGATLCDLRHGGDRAYYSPLPDYVQMPHIQAFKSLEEYKATLLHELVHWAGGSKRLNRDLLNRFGSEAYAAEELIAEIGAAFLCAHLGVHGELRHAGYIENWLKVLKGDKKAIFTAASKASAAADYLRSFSEKEACEDDMAEAA